MDDLISSRRKNTGYHYFYVVYILTTRLYIISYPHPQSLLQKYLCDLSSDIAYTSSNYTDDDFLTLIPRFSEAPSTSPKRLRVAC